MWDLLYPGTVGWLLVSKTLPRPQQKQMCQQHDGGAREDNHSIQNQTQRIRGERGGAKGRRCTQTDGQLRLLSPLRCIAAAR